MDKASKPSSSISRAFLPIRQSLSSTKKQAPLIATSWPKTISLLPDDKLQALVHHHEIISMVSGKMFCWTYISKGLAKLGQKEVIFTVRRRVESEAEVDFPPGPLEWFSILYLLSRDGQIVDEFYQTGFESSPLLDPLKVRLIIYYPPLELSNVPLSIVPRERLHAIPLTASEAQVARCYGVMRAISHLGISERYFPVMPWIDRDRKDCVAPWQMKGSLRDEVPMSSFVGVSCVKRDTAITLHIPRSAEPELKAQVEASATSTVLALDCFPYAKADMGMMWRQGITPSPAAYGAGSSCISFGFLIFCPQQEKNDFLRMEDGIFLSLTDSTFLEIRKAFLQHTPFQMPFGNLQFFLEFESHASQLQGNIGSTSESATPLIAFNGRPPRWALDFDGDNRRAPSQPIRIPFEPFSPAECLFNLRPSIRAEHSPGNTIKRPESVKISLRELKIDKEKGCDKCDILYRAIREYLPFAGQEEDVILQFTTKKAGFVCAVLSQKGLALILEFSSPEGKCHWLTPSTPSAALPKISVDRLTEISHWMSTCRNTHTTCINEHETEPRMRVLDIGKADQTPSRIRLCKSRIPGERYGTLSHCWIFPDEIETTHKNFYEYSAFGLGISKLPQQVQTAIQIFRSLGIRYIWVDALCITQDDEEDWRIYTERTACIYKGSDLTIAVSSNVVCAEGCYMTEEPRYPIKKFRSASVGGSGSYVVEAGYSSIHTPFYEGMQREEHQTMFHRVSSVHQERQFARRIIYLGAEEMVYKCRESCRCECGFGITY